MARLGTVQQARSKKADHKQVEKIYASFGVSTIKSGHFCYITVKGRKCFPKYDRVLGVTALGSVQRSTYNSALDNLARYEDPKKLRWLFKHRDHLYQLAQMGDGVAAAIYVDVQKCLDPKSNILTDIQRECIMMVDIYQMTLQETADQLARSISTVQDNIERGYIRARKSLLTGEAYRGKANANGLQRTSRRRRKLSARKRSDVQKTQPKKTDGLPVSVQLSIFAQVKKRNATEQPER